MTPSLPPYSPPNASRANLAVGLAPLFVLLAFTLVVTRLIDPDTGLATVLACSAWVVWEMHDFQRTVDAYNAEYVGRHLAWRSPQSLHALARSEALSAPTRDFVRRFVDAGHRLLRDGQLP